MQEDKTIPIVFCTCDICDARDKSTFSMNKWFHELHEAYKAEQIDARGAVTTIENHVCNLCHSASIKVTLLW